MEHIEKSENNIKMPFIPLSLNGNQIVVVGSKPIAGRTFYILHLIEENSLKNNNFKCLLYFVGHSKRQTVKQSGFGAMLMKSENVNLNWVNYARNGQFISEIKRKVMDFKPDFIAIDGIEKLFGGALDESELLNEVDMFLNDIRILSAETRIPIVLTTNILLNGESSVSAPRPLLCDFGSYVLEIKADHVLSLINPFYDGEVENKDEEDTWGTMEIYQLNQNTGVFQPTEFIIDKEAGRYYTKPENEILKMKKKKFLLNQKIERLDPVIEIAGLNTLLEGALKEENYETAILIRTRLEQINLERNSENDPVK